MMSRVFVYGTLRQGFGNHRLLEGATFIGPATTAAEFTMLHLGAYPGLIHDGTTQIVGEVYEVDADQLRHLDRLEGHPDFYHRIPARLADPALEVELYVLPPTYREHYRVVASGDWTRRAEE